MTKAGVAFIIAGFIGYFVASQTQVGWLYLFDALIWSVLLLSIVIPWYTLRSLTVEREVLLPRGGAAHLPLEGPLEDDVIDIRFSITPRGRFSRYFVRLSGERPFERPEQRVESFFLFRLPPRRATTFTSSAECYRRGYYPAADITLSAGFPLGLFRKRRVFSLPLRLTVYPRYFPLNGPPFAVESWEEEGQAVKTDAASDFYGSREYRPGDPLRYIHWRNTARTGQLMLKEFERAAQGSLSVVFAADHVYGAGRETTLEYGLRIAASLAGLSAASGRRLDIIAGERPLPDAGWTEAMDYLAMIQPGRGESLPGLVPAVIPDRTVVAVVSAADPLAEPALKSLADRAGRLVVVLLEGFSLPGKETIGASLWRQNNIPVVVCSPGYLEDTVRRLGQALANSDVISAEAD